MLTPICDVMREAYNRRWITTRDGNCAVSRGKYFYITPSGTRKNVIRVEDMIRGEILPDNSLDLDDTIKPSIEMDAHLQLHLASKSKPVATLHLHPTHVVAAMLAGFDLNKIHQYLPELHRYTKVGPSVDEFAPGSEDLASEIFKSMTVDGKIAYDICGQAGHGVMAIAENPWDAFEHIERLDHACEIALKAFSARHDIDTYTISYKDITDGDGNN